jgi:uncharacterized protein
LNEILAKIHQRQNQTLVAVCDKKHLGKNYEDEKLNFRVSEKFFGGEPINKDNLIELIKESNSANLFGDNCVSLLEKEGLINKSSIILINGIKHAQIYNLG